MIGAGRTGSVDAEHGRFARALLLLREATVIAEVPESRVRKDMETGLLVAPVVRRVGDPRIWTSWIEVFTLAAVYGNLRLNNELRKVALSRISDWRETNKQDFRMSYNHADQKLVIESKSRKGSTKNSPLNFKTLELDKYLNLDYAKVFSTVKPRLALYAFGLERIEENPNVADGAAVFEGTRLSVRHVGKVFDESGSMKELLEDYDYLLERDVEFAKLYYLAHPPVGRPARDHGGARA